MAIGSSSLVDQYRHRQLGDMLVYLGQPLEASRVRLRFEERFYELMN